MSRTPIIVAAALAAALAAEPSPTLAQAQSRPGERGPAEPALPKGHPPVEGRKGDEKPAQAQPWQLPGGKLPDTPLGRARALDNLYAHLATAESEQTAAKIAETIERVWLAPGSDTIMVLMERSLKAVAEKKPEIALKFLDAVVELAPDFAEGWNRRAYVHYTNNDPARALGDLRRVLALDPNHFKALDGLGQILREIGQKKAALEAYRKLLAVHPFWKDGEQVLKELEREVGGQGI
jgi:tetratricopeptide (TPR) repeat protein